MTSTKRPSITTRILAIFLAIVTICHSEPRRWTSKDGTKFVVADYVKHDGLTVTVKRPDGKLITLNRTDIAAADAAFLDSLPGPKQQAKNNGNNIKEQPVSDNDSVFGDIKLGDAHKEVREKLAKSSLLELTVDEIYLGRFGLNGSYRTKQTIGGLKCLLYFDWDGDSRLKELTMQTQPKGSDSYDSALKNNWKELVKLMTTLHGKPLQSADYPPSTQLQNDMSLSTHIWRLPKGATAMLGTSKSAEGFMVNVRFTTETIEPVIIEK